MTNHITDLHKSSRALLPMLVQNRPAPVSSNVRLTNITGSLSFSCVEAAMPSCFGSSDTRWYSIRCHRYAVFSVPAFPLWLIHDCQRLEEREMAHSLSTFIITSGETVFSWAPQRGKTCAMMQPAHDQQWNLLATNTITNFLLLLLLTTANNRWSPKVLWQRYFSCHVTDRLSTSKCMLSDVVAHTKSFAVHSAVTSLQQTPSEK